MNTVSAPAPSEPGRTIGVNVPLSVLGSSRGSITRLRRHGLNNSKACRSSMTRGIHRILQEDHELERAQ